MTNNNYKAPSTALADQPLPELPPRPRNVNVALVLIGVAALMPGVMALEYLVDINFQFDDLWPWATWILGYILIGVICYQLARAARWARVVLLLITLIRFAQLCWAIGYIWRNMPDMWGVILDGRYLFTTVLPLVMNMIALHLLYFASGDWFTARANIHQ